MGAKSIIVIFGILFIVINVIGWLIAQGITGPILKSLPVSATVYSVSNVVLALLMMIFGLRNKKRRRVIREE